MVGHVLRRVPRVIEARPGQVQTRRAAANERETMSKPPGDDPRDYIEANRRAWDEAAPYHRRHAQFDALLAGFARPGFSCLDAVATARLNALGLVGRA